MGKKVSFGTKPNPQAPNGTPSADNWVEKGSLETEPTKRFTIDVPESLHRRIKAQCAERGLKMADEVRVLLEKHFPTKA
jgi:polyhydroxyalkanoate synthesis regulator phasin